MKSIQIACLVTCLALHLSVLIQNAKAGYFLDAGSMNTPRYDHTATLLTNGQVLVVAGKGNEIGYLSSAELYDAMNGVWTNTGTLQTAREIHTATLLTNGRVLVTGGYAINSSNLTSSCELYDTSSGSWNASGSMNKARSQHTATLLQNGTVLVAGGWTGYGNGTFTGSAEIYDPATGNWTPTGSMTNARLSHTATLLKNGKVLVAGGQNQTTPFSSAELYDPVTGTWTVTGSMNKSRSFHTATLLSNGLVLVAGGTKDGAVSAELYDPSNGNWIVAGSMKTPRTAHTATLLTNGLVLVCGGSTPSEYIGSAELFDPASNTWFPTGPLSLAKGQFASVLTSNGCVFVAGGFNNSPYGAVSSTEIYFPSGDSSPFIISQPQSVGVTNGHFASFTVVATGVSPLTYQWRFNDSNIFNSTNTEITLPNVFPSHAGFYTVVVNSSYGSTTSNPALLTVLPLKITAPLILSNGQFQFGFDTAAGVDYSVEYSTNLTHWFPMLILRGVGIPLSVIDPNAVNAQQRFYRIKLSPQ